MLKLSNNSRNSWETFIADLDNKLLIEQQEYGFDENDISQENIRQIDRNLGRSQFTVEKFFHKCNQKFMAAKTCCVLNRYGRLELDDARKLKTELMVFKKLKNSEDSDDLSLVEIYGLGFNRTTRNFYLCMELMDIGSLREACYVISSAEQYFPEYIIAIVVYLMVNVLEYCQKHNIMHRDFKPANILINKNGKLKLSDFGEAIELADERNSTMTGAGSLKYLPPERLEISGARKYDYKSDVWSLGVSLVELFQGKHPFSSASDIVEIQQLIKRSSFETLKLSEDDFSYSAIANEFLELCFKKVEQRPSFSDLKKTTFYELGEIYSEATLESYFSGYREIINLDFIIQLKDEGKLSDDRMSNMNFLFKYNKLNELATEQALSDDKKSILLQACSAYIYSLIQYYRGTYKTAISNLENPIRDEIVYANKELYDSTRHLLLYYKTTTPAYPVSDESLVKVVNKVEYLKNKVNNQVPKLYENKADDQEYLLKLAQDYQKDFDQECQTIIEMFQKITAEETSTRDSTSSDISVIELYNIDEEASISDISIVEPPESFTDNCESIPIASDERNNHPTFVGLL